MGKDLTGKELGKGICQRKDGVYQARIFHAGNHKPIYIYATSIRELKKKRSQTLTKKSNGIEINQPNQTVDNWFEQWMNLYIVGRLKPTTIRNYISSYNRGKKYIGLIKLNDVTSNHIQYMLNQLKSQGYAASSINSTYSTVSCLFEKAVASRLILFNPCKGVVASTPKNFNPKSKEEKEEKYLSDYEIELFFDACKNTRYYELFYILLHTGMRIGEACALEWKDIDFENGFINIDKTIHRTRIYYDEYGNKITFPSEKILITTPKTQNSYRKIPMNDDVVCAFKTWQQKQSADKTKQKKSWGKSNPLLKEYPDPVFTTRNGKHYLPVYAQSECSRITSIVNKREIVAAQKENREARTIKVHPHLFRHTFTTHCYESGMDPASIMQIVGHAHMNMVEYYTHPTSEFITKEFNKYIEEMHKYA